MIYGGWSFNDLDVPSLVTNAASHPDING